MERRGKVSIQPDGSVPDGAVVDPDTAHFYAVWRDETERRIGEAPFRGVEPALDWGRERADVVWIALGNDLETLYSAGATHTESLQRWPPTGRPAAEWWPQPELPTLEEVAGVAADAREGRVPHEQAAAWVSDRTVEAGTRGLDDPRFLALAELADELHRRQPVSDEEPLAPTLTAALERLSEMLNAAGLDSSAAFDPEATLRVFCEFAAQPVEGVAHRPDDDMLIFEYDVYDRRDGYPPTFVWTLCRQFTIYANDEYDHMEHLSCTLDFEPTPDLELTGSTGFLPSTMLDEWAAEVERLDGFDAVRGLTPILWQVRQERV
jgi:hypothetical protein